MKVSLKIPFEAISQKVNDAYEAGMLDIGTKVVEFATDTVPHKTSALQTSTQGYPRKIAKHKYVVAFNKEYAAFQERGKRADGSHVVKNYSEAGTGPHYLENAAKKVGQKATEILRYYLTTSGGVK